MSAEMLSRCAAAFADALQSGDNETIVAAAVDALDAGVPGIMRRSDGMLCVHIAGNRWCELGLDPREAAA